MWRYIVLIACALIVADATGLIADCDETCQDDDNGKDRCPPACSDCSCPGHAMRVAALRCEVVAVVNLAGDQHAGVDALPPTIELGLLDPAPDLRPPIA